MLKNKSEKVFDEGGSNRPERGLEAPNTYPTPGNGLDRGSGEGENRERPFYKLGRHRGTREV